MQRDWLTTHAELFCWHSPSLCSKTPPVFSVMISKSGICPPPAFPRVHHWVNSSSQPVALSWRLPRRRRSYRSFTTIVTDYLSPCVPNALPPARPRGQPSSEGRARPSQADAEGLMAAAAQQTVRESWGDSTPWEPKLPRGHSLRCLPTALGFGCF